jgi:hypothetical protein
MALNNSASSSLLKIYGGYSPAKLDVDVNQREIKIEITPDIIKRAEKCKRMMADFPEEPKKTILDSLLSDNKEDENKEEKPPI